MKHRRCNFKPCLIYFKGKELYDLPSYCCECGKIGAAGNDDDRVTNDNVDGRVRWRLRTSPELKSQCAEKMPVIEVIDEPNGVDGAER